MHDKRFIPRTVSKCELCKLRKGGEYIMFDNLELVADECDACGITADGYELVCAYHEELYSCEDTLALTYEPIEVAY